MKVMLILENRPALCGDCPCWDNIGYCNAADKPAGMYQQPEFCPLKPMPQKKHLDESLDLENFTEYLRFDGWNACIEEIEKCITQNQDIST